MSVQPTEQPSDAQKLADALARNKALDNEVTSLKAQLQSALAPKPQSPSKFKEALKKFGASILAALTTPEAIKVEKSLAVIALTRALILVPALAAVIDIILAALGGPSVGVK